MTRKRVAAQSLLFLFTFCHYCEYLLFKLCLDDNNRIVHAILHTQVVCKFFSQPTSQQNWNSVPPSENTNSGQNIQSPTQPLSNSGLEGPETPEGKDEVGFIKIDSSITSLLNCFRLECLFNNVLNNISLKNNLS